MNVNDKIALELGRAHLQRIVAESQVEDLREQVTQRDTLIADLQARVPDDDGPPAPP